MYKIQFTNKDTGNVGVGNILTKEIDVKGGTAYRVPVNIDEAQEICDYANENYVNANHIIIGNTDFLV